MKVIHLHIGLQKTGTSSVQARLIREGGPLAAAGIDPLLAAVAPSWAHHNAAWEAGRHKRHQRGEPGLAALVAAAHASPSERLFVSSEDFSILEPKGVRALAEALAGFEVRPILVLRNQVDFAESIFAQASKARLPGHFPAYLDRLEAGGRLAYDRIANRWRRAFGEAAMTMLAYEDHADIAAAICATLGVEPGPPSAARHNQSFNERFVAASQRVLARLAMGETRQGVARIDLGRAEALSRAMMATAAREPRFAGKPVFMSAPEARALLDRMAEANRRIARRLPLPAPWFAPDALRRAPQEATPEDEALLMAGLAPVLAAGGARGA